MSILSFHKSKNITGSFRSRSFYGHRFVDCSFINVDLTLADFSKVEFIGCYFSNCLFDRTLMLGTIISECRGELIDFRGAVLDESVIEDSSFSKLSIYQCNWKNVTITSTSLSRVFFIRSVATGFKMYHFNLMLYTSFAGLVKDTEVVESGLEKGLLKFFTLDRVDIEGTDLRSILTYSSKAVHCKMRGGKISKGWFRCSGVDGFSLIDVEKELICVSG